MKDLYTNKILIKLIKKIELLKSKDEAIEFINNYRDIIKELSNITNKTIRIELDNYYLYFFFDTKEIIRILY